MFVNDFTRILYGDSIKLDSNHKYRYGSTKLALMSVLDQNNSVVNFEKHAGRGYRDDSESEISKKPAAFRHDKLVLPKQPHLQKKYKWYPRTEATWMPFLEALPYFSHLPRQIIFSLRPIVAVALPFSVFLLY